MLCSKKALALKLIANYDVCMFFCVPTCFFLQVFFPTVQKHRD